MSDSKTPSERQKKRVISQGLQQLKGKPGWDIEAFQQRNQGQGLRDLEQKMRDHQVYGEAQACQGCVAARQATDDDTALCDHHLAQAMGFGED